MPTNNDCPVRNGRKIIFTQDYQDCEREEPCPHCSEREHCASCLTLRAENARVRERMTLTHRDIAVILHMFKSSSDDWDAEDLAMESRLNDAYIAALKEPGV